MEDVTDYASDAEELHRNFAINQHRKNRNIASAEFCEECGEDIPAPRRAAVPGCQTCASCQADLELIRKQRGS